MTEEEAIYATAEGKMRHALEVAKGWLFQLKDADSPLTSTGTESFEIVIKEINDALVMKSPEFDIYSPAQVQRMIRDAYDEGKTEQEIETVSKLVELPEMIKIQSLKLAELTNDIEALRLSLANTKNEALELVLSATENGKPKYSNDKARDMAVKQVLRENLLYLDTVDGLSRKECELRKEQIQLDFLHNSFNAFRAIAGLAGVR